MTRLSLRWLLPWIAMAAPPVPTTEDSPLAPAFYIVPLDTGELEACYLRMTGARSLFAEAGKDNDHVLAELWLQRALASHARRARLLQDAALLYLPALPSMSLFVDERDSAKVCPSGSLGDHLSRMRAAAVAARVAAAHTKRPMRGLIVASGPYAMTALGRALRALNRPSPAAVDRLRSRAASTGDATSRALWVLANQENWGGGLETWPARVAMPYAANAELTRSASLTPDREASRPFSIMSVGQWSHGLRQNGSSGTPGGQLLRVALSSWARLPRTHVSLLAGRSPLAPEAQALLDRHSANDSAAPLRFAPVAYAQLLRNATFCVVPRGDTPTTRKLYDALAAGCVPVIVSDPWTAAGSRLRPFPHAAALSDWARFAIVVSEDELMRDGATAGERVLATPASELGALRRAGRRAARALLFGWGAPPNATETNAPPSHERWDATAGTVYGDAASLLLREVCCERFKHRGALKPCSTEVCWQWE